MEDVGKIFEAVERIRTQRPELCPDALFARLEAAGSKIIEEEMAILNEALSPGDAIVGAALDDTGTGIIYINNNKHNVNDNNNNKHENNNNIATKIDINNNNHKSIADNDNIGIEKNYSDGRNAGGDIVIINEVSPPKKGEKQRKPQQQATVKNDLEDNDLEALEPPAKKCRVNTDVEHATAPTITGGAGNEVVDDETTPDGATATLDEIDQRAGPSHVESPAQLQLQDRFPGFPEFKTLECHQQRVFAFVSDMYPDARLTWLADSLRETYADNPDQLVNDLITGKRLINSPNEAQPSVSEADEPRVETCNTCFNDECVPEDMIQCYEGQHSYCRECLTNHARVAIEERRPRVNCMSEECDSLYADGVLRKILTREQFETFDNIRINVDVKQAGLENLETCEFCNFMIEMPNVDDKVLACLNPNCGKETCRLCRKESHIPLSCKEVTNDDPETSYRTYVENKMAEALIRVCPKCSSRIVKTKGCNKMVCSCGAYMCYVCRQLLDPSSYAFHFSGSLLNGGRGCPGQSKEKDIHENAVIKAGNEARDEFLTQNPRIAAVVKIKNLELDINKLAKKK